MPDRAAVHRRRERVEGMMHELPEPAQEAIRRSYEQRDADARGGDTREYGRPEGLEREQVTVVSAGAPSSEEPTQETPRDSGEQAQKPAPFDPTLTDGRDDRPTDVHPAVTDDGPAPDDRPTDIRPLPPVDGGPVREDDAWTGRAVQGSAAPDPYTDPYSGSGGDPYVADAYGAGPDENAGDEPGGSDKGGRRRLRFWGKGDDA